MFYKKSVTKFSLFCIEDSVRKRWEMIFHTLTSGKDRIKAMQLLNVFHDALVIQNKLHAKFLAYK
jgi:hypothetical protein